jgi:hypothetical protein
MREYDSVIVILGHHKSSKLLMHLENANLSIAIGVYGHTALNVPDLVYSDRRGISGCLKGGMERERRIRR